MSGSDGDPPGSERGASGRDTGASAGKQEGPGAHWKWRQGVV